MSFRKRLIILLVCLSIVPILALRTFGIHNVHLFADEVIRQVHLNYQKSSDLQFNAVAQHHQKRIGKQRLKDILRENAGADARIIATAVMDAVDAFQEGSRRSDDVTCVVVKFTG